MRVTKGQLLAILRHATESISWGDSYEGTIEWKAVDGDSFVVVGAYRFDNLRGQWSVRVLGAPEEQG